MYGNQLVQTKLFFADCRGLECIRGQTTSSSPPPLSSFPSSFLSSFPSSFPSSSSVVVVSSSRRSLDQLVPGTPPNDGERKHRDGGAVLPFVGLTGSAQQSRRCCKNGGTCILGSFCACPPFFSGRICEYDERIRSCGPIPHGIWVQKGCSYCRCGYGLLHCFPHVFHKDCGKIHFVGTRFLNFAASVCLHKLM
uniref:EGF-like domain-containing protein n=1 Tax=Stegastes partitus TaxID=144197 RepID=A0A3B4ZGG9_9TELE